MAATNDFFASSPFVAQPPHPTTGYFSTNASTGSIPSAPTTNGFGDSLTPSTASLPVTPGAIAGRKRSRGDIHSPQDEEMTHEDGSVATPASGIFLQQSESLGPDNASHQARLEPPSGYQIGNGTQVHQFQSLQEHHRPSMNTRKSQRMDSAAAGSDDLAQLVLPPHIREVTAEPLIDEATRTLGISWTRMDSSEPHRISQAAYQKWIQNHYPSLKEVAIWFENSAIPGYLVAAQNAYSARTEYYIFSQDLTEARLVTSEAAQLIPRLQMLPALHLAAPGGCIKAESDSMIPERPKTGSRHYARISEDFSMTASMLRGYFPSYEMETD